MTFSYTRFPVKKINVEKIFKIMKKLLFNYYFYSHPEIGKFQGVTQRGEREEARGTGKRRGGEGRAVVVETRSAGARG
jgi:hypothetical protein